MNKVNLKSYAPQARKDFITAVTARANQLGLSNKAGELEVAIAQTQGDVTLIAGQAWPSKINDQRDKLIENIRKDGFEHTMESVAYTWFNRFAALRFMELHDYLGHGYRALSSTAGGLPDILTHAADLTNDLPGLNAAKITDLKLAGNRDGELYRMLLVAQCNALSRTMPFLFERIDDDSELLLPDNLLRSDSVIAKLVKEIPEEDWTEVEIIGWLYQFYISEKKDQVIGKVVKSEDIPAATQLFTPNWIVQYLVQNSVGRLWLMANPQSSLAKEWPYYIPPAEQTSEVQAQLDALIQTRAREDGDTLNPESITVLDPACGSGHILVVAYDALKSIYLERGYQPRSIPRLILEKNLFGLDIDDRATQMAGFALLMKARADDRRLFTATDETGSLQSPKLNVFCLQESKGLSVDELAIHLSPFKVHRATIAVLIDIFEHAKTFGSLTQIPYHVKTQLNSLSEILRLVKIEGDIYAQASATDLLPLVQQAQVLAMQFDAIVANPPYMGTKGMTPTVKSYLRTNYPSGEKDLFAAFIVRATEWGKGETSQISMVTPFSWMYLSSFEQLRQQLLSNSTIQSLIELETNAFEPAMVTVCAFTFSPSTRSDYCGSFIRLSDFKGSQNQAPRTLEAIANPDCGWMYRTKVGDFSRVPGSPIAYWLGASSFSAFGRDKKMSAVASARIGMATGRNDYYVRLWWEVSSKSTKLDCESREESVVSGCTWFPYAKGGDFRRWYGNHVALVNWKNDGVELQTTLHPDGARIWAHNFNLEHIFQEAMSWTFVTSGPSSFRFQPKGFLFDSAAGLCRAKTGYGSFEVLGWLNSTVAMNWLRALNPTLNLPPGAIEALPFPDYGNDGSVQRLVELSKLDWDAFERSWDFQGNPLICDGLPRAKTLESSFNSWINFNADTLVEMKRLEEMNNAKIIDKFSLGNEITPKVPLEQITLTTNPAYRYGSKFSDEEKVIRLRQDTTSELVSYAIGCMMGRYSLDEPGLIYACSGNVGFNPDRYRIFSADEDGILPITDELWFKDDAPVRIREFLRAVWGPENLEENLAWLAEGLGSKASETPDETIRRYIADKFFKDHLQNYKKRPIYWLFSSGKQGAFQALVYLHRYSEGTLARLRAEYVVPLTGKLQSRIEMLQKDAAAASSIPARNKFTKEVEKLKKKHLELLAYDEQLRHFADMRITLDLDDGVKMNYGKFGDLLAEVKAVTGGASDD